MCKKTEDRKECCTEEVATTGCCTEEVATTGCCTEEVATTGCGAEKVATTGCGAEKVAFVNVVEESEATGKVKDIYETIKKTLGIDFVPNMYKAMANNPEYLDTSWKKIQAVMTKQGRLDGKTKDIVALTVSIMSGCEPCIGVYNDAVKHAGLDDEALTELYSIIDTYAGLNRLNIAWGVKPDKKPWYGCAGN